MSLIRLLTTTICKTYEFVTKRSKDSNPKAFVIRFCKKVNTEVEEGQRYVDLAICNKAEKVGVYTRDCWNIIPAEDLEYNEEFGSLAAKEGKAFSKGVTPWVLLGSEALGWDVIVYNFLRENGGTFNSLENDSYPLLLNPTDLGLDLNSAIGPDQKDSDTLVLGFKYCECGCHCHTVSHPVLGKTIDLSLYNNLQGKVTLFLGHGVMGPQIFEGRSFEEGREAAARYVAADPSYIPYKT